ESLEALPFVRECSMHGAFIHVLLNEESYIPALQNFASVRPIPIMPTLEDVFIALARKKEKVAVTA
ncbi:MAG: ABC transporter ATP-binding protein, partial [Syntrophomonas sp.]|nr:ABC transporter ATP-binding protein [Syntrophomonas sp.]